jgi:hypothetical protein
MGYSNYHVQGLQILLYPPRKRRTHVSREKFSLQVLGILYRIIVVSPLPTPLAILAAGAINWSLCEVSRFQSIIMIKILIVFK